MASKSLKRTQGKPPAKPAITNQDSTGGTCKCSYCGKEYVSQTNNFFASDSPLYAGNNKRMTVCKKCIDKMLEDYTRVFDGDTSKAIERICQITDTYYSKRQWRLIEESGRDKTFGEYIKTLNLSSDKRSYSQTFLEHIAEIEKLIEEASVIPVTPIETPEISVKTKMLFGSGFKDTEYESLQFEYDNWVDMYGEPISKKHRELYVTLCYLKLQLQRSVQNGENNTSTLSNAYKGILDAATTEIEDRKKKEEANIALSPIGVFYQDIEKYTPAEYFKDKKLYEDFDHLKEYAQRFIFRPLKNLLTGSKDTDKEFNLSGSED